MILKGRETTKMGSRLFVWSEKKGLKNQGGEGQKEKLP